MAQLPPTRCKRSEHGYILLGVLILLALFVIAMAVAAPRIASDIQRDRDVATMQRGKQYIRAVQLYYRKFNAYPPSIDALVKTNEIRFLRKRYIDPTTGKDDWKPVMFCQNKAPLAMGFFGQPLGGVTGCGPIAGTGPSGGNGLDNSGMFGSNNNGSNGQIGSPVGGPGGGIGGGPNGGLSSNPSTPGSTTSPTGQPGQPGQTAPTDGSGTGRGSTGSTDANGNPIGGQTFGGGGIVGFSPVSPKQSILVYKKKNHYNEWEFTYTPLMDQQQMMGGNTGAIGQPVGGQNPTGLNPTVPTSPVGPGGPGGPGGLTPPQQPPSTTPQQ